MKQFCFLLFLFVFSITSQAQTPPFVIANIGGLNLSIETDTCFAGAGITSLSPNQKLVSSETLSSNCGIWQRVSIPSITQHVDTSGYICGGLSALCDIVPETNQPFVEVYNTDTTGLFVRPAPVAGHITINGLNAKIWDGQRFAVTGNTQTVGGGMWREIYLTDNCSQLTGWVSNTFLIYYTGVGLNENENFLQVNIFPNPASDKIEINFQNPLMKDFKIELLDVQGKIIGIYSNIDKINISELAQGEYLIVLEQDGYKSAQKFIKQ